MTRLAVISDVHGNLPALEAVEADLGRRGVQRTVNLGDHLSGPLWPRETAARLRRRDWIHIAGNHDRWLAGGNPSSLGPSDAFARARLGRPDLEWLKSLPARMELPGGLLLFHGTPDNDNAYLLETVHGGRARLADPEEIRTRLRGVQAPVVLCGHSHVPRFTAGPGGRLILNPGSVGLQAYDDTTSEPHVIETGSPEARYALLEKRDTGWAAEFMVVPYDHRSAASRARRQGRPEWAAALETGFFPEKKRWKPARRPGKTG
jgi:predicted phosphodiesterase